MIAIETWVIVNALLEPPDRPGACRRSTRSSWCPCCSSAALLLLLVGTQLGSARSPHVVFRPEQVDVRLDDVIGIDPVKEDVRRSIDLFQTHKQFAEQMGGTPRRGLLFEGLPGTGKTMTAKAMAAEAGVPFLFVSATSFQSMYYGATAKKIRVVLQGPAQGGPHRGRRDRLHRGDRRDRDAPRRHGVRDGGRRARSTRSAIPHTVTNAGGQRGRPAVS